MSETTLEEAHQTCLDWRGIDPKDACEECGGSGYSTYGDTSTWRGGVGGQAITSDVCDRCWGSGDRFRPWPDRRRSPSPGRQHED